MSWSVGFLLLNVPKNKSGIHTFDASKWLQMCPGCETLALTFTRQSWATCQHHNNAEEPLLQTNALLPDLEVCLHHIQAVIFALQDAGLQLRQHAE